MQIPPASSASLASILSQSTSKDKASGAGEIAADATPTSEANVEKSGSTSSDRDAQGQGDGLGERPDGKHQDKDVKDVIDIADIEQPPLVSPALPDEPPGELDIVG